MFAYLNHHNARLSQFSMTLTTYYSKLYQQEGGGGEESRGSFDQRYYLRVVLGMIPTMFWRRLLTFLNEFVDGFTSFSQYILLRWIKHQHTCLCLVCFHRQRVKLHKVKVLVSRERSTAQRICLNDYHLILMRLNLDCGRSSGQTEV